MVDLSKAPLIETYFELRWGSAEGEGQAKKITFGHEDLLFFPGQFRKAAADQGFGELEELPDLRPPFTPRYRFRRAAAAWPCLQIGHGLFSVNQVNEGYSWESFLDSARLGLSILDVGHPRGLSGLPAIGAELTYIDGLPWGAEPPLAFMRNKLLLTLSPPKLENVDVDENPRALRVELTLDTRVPRGSLILELAQGEINGEAGFVVTTRLRSAEAACPTFGIDQLAAWLTSAHEVLIATFKQLIQPAYYEEFR